MQVSKLILIILAVCVPACTSSMNSNDVMLQSTDAISPADFQPGTSAIGRFTSQPYVTRSETFRVEVSAYHASGIAGVEFILDGHKYWVTKQTPNRRGYYEYALRVRPSTLAPGLHEVTATIIPNEGSALTLSGNSTDHNDIKNGYNSFFFNTGNDLVVEVGAKEEFQTVSQAVEFHGEALTHGGTVKLRGDHVLDMPKLNNSDSRTVMTIEGNGRTIVNNFGGLVRASNDSSFQFKNIRFHCDDTSGRFFRGSRNGRLILTDCELFSTEVEGWKQQFQYLGKSVESDWGLGLWVEGLDIYNIWKGMLGVHTAKHIFADRLTGDFFGSSPGGVYDATVVSMVKDYVYHQQHSDIVQYSTGEVTDNRIFADIFAPKQRSQIGHISRTELMTNIAFINWHIDATECVNSPSVNMKPRFDNLLIHNVTLIRGSFQWEKDNTFKNTNVSIRNMLNYRQTLDRFPFASYDDIEIRFTDRMQSDWGVGCTVGPVIFHDDLSWSPVVSF